MDEIKLLKQLKKFIKDTAEGNQMLEAGLCFSVSIMYKRGIITFTERVFLNRIIEDNSLWWDKGSFYFKPYKLYPRIWYINFLILKLRLTT